MTQKIKILPDRAGKSDSGTGCQRVFSDLVNNIDAVFLVHDHYIVRVGGGREKLETPSAGPIHLADEIAGVCAGLLARDHGEKGKVALLLPPAEFVVTSFSFPEMSEKEVIQALTIQEKSLFPGLEEDLLLSVNVASVGRGKNGYGFWLRKQRAEELFAAFEKHGMFLVSIAPRTVACGKNGAAFSLLDSDAQTKTLYRCSHGVIETWQYIHKSDLKNRDFAEEWEEVLDMAGDIHLVDDVDTWEQIPLPDFSSIPIKFVPESGIKNIEKSRATKKRRTLVSVLVVILVLFAAPVLFNNVQLYYLNKRLERLKTETSGILKLQEAVLDYNKQWALLKDFPEQDVMYVLQVLNDIIPNDSWIKSVMIENGVVEIEGYSGDLATLVEVINENRLFDNVAFSHAVRSDNKGKGVDMFGLRFTLSGIDIDSYLQKYFPASDLQ